jgi:CMP-N-acetylneuraminic acid synthetase
MKYLAVIPARGGSKGIPNKNIIDVAGNPLIYYTIREAKNSRLDKVVVSTDCDMVAAVCRDLDVEVVKRPEKLAEDASPTLPVLQHALRVQEDESYGAVVTLQPTSPLRRARHIDEALTLFESNLESDSLVSVVKVPHNFVPTSIMQKGDSYFKSYIDAPKQILRRQDKPVFYARNGAAIYITRTGNIDKYVFGGNILGYEMSYIDSFDIDDPDDLEIVRSLMNNRHE